MPMQASAAVILPFHILGGILALITGYVALYGVKGSTTHRRGGTIFVYAMVVMSLTGAFIAVLHANAVSTVAGLMTFYLVATGMRTVQQRVAPVSSIDRAATMFALMVAAACFVVGIQSAAAGRPEASPMFLFGIVGLLGAFGDRRVMRQGGVQGSRRLARHLWRMCFAMWVAAASFFWGPQTRVPEMLRIPLLQAMAVLLPIVVMAYWLWRLRARRPVPGIVHTTTASEAAL